MEKRIEPGVYPGLTDGERRQIDRVLKGWRASRAAVLQGAVPALDRGQSPMKPTGPTEPAV